MRSRGPLHRAARAVARRALRRAAHSWSGPTPEVDLSRWRLERDAEGQLTLGGVRLSELGRRYEAPVHVVDAQRLRENAERFVTALGRAGDVFYSYKANPVPGVLRELHELGCGAEASSPFELWLARTLNVPGERVIYNCPVKPERSLREAVRAGVGLINVNSRQELATVAQVARSLGRRVRIGVRVALPDTDSGQFGEQIDDGSALQTFSEALERPELEVAGMHVHPHGEIATFGDVHGLLSSALRFTTVLRATLGLELQVLDVGGNLAVPTVQRRSAAQQRVEMALGTESAPPAPTQTLSIEDYVDEIVNRVGAHYRRAGRTVPRIVLEPGRGLTSNAQLMLLNVLQVRSADDTGISTVVLDGGVNVADPLKSERHEVLATRVRPGEPQFRYRLVGPTCSQNDLLYPCVELPRIEAGDTLAVMDSGAYFIPFSTTFSFPRPGVVMLDEGAETVLRRPETFEDLVALDRLDAA